MRKIKLVSGLLFLTSLSLTSCANDSQAPAQTGNQAPLIVGVKDLECVVNSRLDLLDGVTALDREEGDITPRMQISISPSTEVIDGYATFKEVGTYSVTYTVSDKDEKDQRKTTKTSFIDVVLREKYLSFDMPNGFYSEVNGNATFEACGMLNKKFVVKASGHVVAEDVKINKDFTLKTNSQYEFAYKITSNSHGKIKALADGLLCGEANITEGDNLFTFKHIVLDNKKDNRDVTISLCLGAIEGDIDLVITDLETVLFRNEEDIGKPVDLTGDFVFTGKVEARFDSSKGAKGKAFASDDGKSVVLENEIAIAEDWAAGVFVTSGLTLKEDVNYTVSFDVEADSKDEPFDVILKCGQWGENNYVKLSNTELEPLAKHQECNITPTSANAGSFWVYIQSGLAINRIVFSNLKVVEHLGPTDKEIYKIEDFTEEHKDLYNSNLTSAFGSFVYNITSFGPNDSDHKVYSPSFFINGSGSIYVLSFKAKASAPIEFVTVTHPTDVWDPTLNWNRVKLKENEEETAFTFFYGGNGGNRDYLIEWQFGSGNNQEYQNVDITISDICISLRNTELDG